MGRFYISPHPKTRNRIAFGTFSVTQKRGFFYMIGRDCKYRPIIVVDVEKIHDADLK